MSNPYPAVLTASDRLMWRIERDPVLRSPVVVVGLLDVEPDPSATMATWQRAVARVPRLRQRIRAGGPAGRRLRWEDDPHLSLEYHVRRIRVPAPADLRAVLDLAAPWVTAALDPARPLWECTIVEGLAGGRAAFVLKFHHAITDGVGGVDLAGTVFDAERAGSTAPSPVPAPSATGVLTAVPERVAELFGAGLRGARRAAGLARQPLRVGRSVARLLEPASLPLSPLWLERGLDRHLGVLEVPLAELQRAAHGFGATVNEVFLAALAGGLHDLHERHGHQVPALRVTMPVNLRRPDDPPGGNHFTPVRFVLPIDDPDVAHRVQVVRSISRRWRDEPSLGLTDVLAQGLDLLPDGAVTTVFASMLRSVDVDAVDVPGLRRPAYLGGAEVERLWAFAPPTGAAVSVTLLSHCDTACVGILADRAAVSDPELLGSCLHRALDEVLAAGASVPAPPEPAEVAP